MTFFNPSYTSLTQSQASLQIEQLVKAIARSKQPAFRIVSHAPMGESAIPTSLGSLLLDINSLLNVHDDHYEYSEHLQVFFQACQDIGLERHLQSAACLDETSTYFLSFYWSMNRLVDRIRELVQLRAFTRRPDDRRCQSKRNSARMETYVRGVLGMYSRTVVLRINLYYLGITQSRLRVEQVYDDLAILIKTRDRTHETGYVWSVEQGGQTGSFHIHAAFFFNGAHVRSDWAKGVAIGELWKQITRGRGYAHICDSSPGRYKALGIGMIKRNAPEACYNAVNAVRYLTKDDQHLRVKPKGARTYGTGQL